MPTIPQSATYREGDSPDPRAGCYYVSVLNNAGDRYVLALGPYDRHSDALANVDRVSRYVTEHDRQGIWYGYGTCRLDRTFGDPGAPAGKLNERLGMFPMART